MQLTDELRSRIASEFRYAADHMRSEEDPHTKLYYYSALFGEVTRILNLNWDRDLVLAYTVLSATHSQVAGMAHNIGSGRERAIKLTVEHIEALTNAASDLAGYFETDGTDAELYSLLGRISEIGYASTGNGWYLLQKGDINL
jgi:hypothetical protein